jgi:hypothetical protein
MLKKTNITKIEIFSPEWHQFRLGRITSSAVHCLMWERGNGDGAISYIYQKVGEELTGLAAMNEIDTDATRWGLQYENEAIEKFGKAKGLEFIVTQKIIGDPDERFSSTPDGIWVHNESTDANHYNVSTLEVKCPPTYNAYIGLCLCETPQDLKIENKQYYWQVIDQMLVCDALYGYFIAYHPSFSAGNMQIIEFRKLHLMEEFKALKKKKEWALEKFNETRTKMLSKSVY